MENRKVNALFFIIVLGCILSIHLLHIELIVGTSKSAHLLFTVHAILQSLTECVLLYAIAHMLTRFFHKNFYYIFVSLVFILLMVHITDFFLVRIMSLPFFTALDLILDESPENFIEMLQLTGIPLSVWAMLLILAVVILPLLGLIVHALASKVSPQSETPFLSGKQLFQLLILFPALLFVMDVAILPSVSKKEYMKYVTALPFKSTVLPVPNIRMQFDKAYGRPREGDVTSVQGEKKHLPNIYFFVVESVREDYLTSAIAPNVSLFREQNPLMPYTLSAANCTHKSWYSIFHANHAVHWADSRGPQQLGALPLRMLKEMGYKINLYAAAQLKYYGVDELLFGKETALLDEKKVFPHYAPKEAYESDLEACHAFFDDLQKEDKKEGNVFLVFFDSTHFEYSWSPEYEVPYSSNELGISHVQVTQDSNRIEVLQKRYSNAIHFLDALFGEFVFLAKSKGLYDDSIVVFTADHGEEHYEEGRLFHASHLSSMQTRVPIYIKLGRDNTLHDIASKIRVSSHVDIFPTILDHLTEGKADLTSFDGFSLLQKNDDRYALVARYNGNRASYEFYVHNGTYKCLAQFMEKKNVYGSKEIQILQLFNKNEEEVIQGDQKNIIIKEFHTFFEQNFRD